MMGQEFLGELERGEDGKGYVFAGHVWRGAHVLAGWEVLTLDIDEATYIEIGSCRGSDSFMWVYVKRLAEDVLFRQQAVVETLEKAAEEALGYEPKMLTLEYLGRSFVCYGVDTPTGATCWEFAVDGEYATVTGPHAAITKEDSPYWRWARRWLPAEPLLEEFCGDHSLRGKRPSLREAMIAAIDAPELFKRACGQLISALKEGPQ